MLWRNTYNIDLQRTTGSHRIDRIDHNAYRQRNYRQHNKHPTTNAIKLLRCLPTDPNDIIISDTETFCPTLCVLRLRAKLSRFSNHVMYELVVTDKTTRGRYDNNKYVPNQIMKVTLQSTCEGFD